MTDILSTGLNVAGSLLDLIGGIGAGRRRRAAAREAERLATERLAALAPYRDAGVAGLSAWRRLADDPSRLAAEPGFRFRLAEGTRAIENAASARGLTLSGAQLRALNRFGQDYAASEFDRALGRYRDLIGVGLEAETLSGRAADGIADARQARADAPTSIDAWGRALGRWSRLV